MSHLEALVERSREPSRALSVIAGYFNVTGVLNALTWLAVLAAAQAGVRPFAPLLKLSPLRTVGVLLTAAMFLRVGQLLHRRRREGAFWAIAAFAPGLVSRLMGHSTPLSSFGIVVPLVGLGLVGLVWKELE